MENYKVLKSENRAEKCEQVLEIEISTEEIGMYRSKSLKNLTSKADMPGFRKGHVPESIIIEKLGELAILEEAINAWLKDAVGNIIQNDTPEAIALPYVSVTKAVPGNPVTLSMVVPLRPKLKLPDYKKIAVDKNSKMEKIPETTEKEVNEAILRLRQYAARAAKGESTPQEIKEDELPPLNDQFAEVVGGGKTVDELRDRVKKDLESENENKFKEKHRLSIIDEILKKTEGAIPDLLTEHELEKMEAEFESDVKRMGLSIENYLKDSKKIREDLIKDWKPTAEKRAKVNLILAEIKKAEKIEADKEAVDHEVEHFLEHQKDANPERVRDYINRMLSNQKVFEFLEQQK